MARIRTIKPEFFTSLTIAALPIPARLTFIGLWTYADDAGRAINDARLIRAALWPLDDRRTSDVEKDLDQLEEAGLIVRYQVGVKRYLAMTSWDEHQRINRASESKLPGPDDPSVTTPGALSEDSPPSRAPAEGKGKEQGARGDARAHTRGSKRCPPDFEPDAEHVQLAAQCGADLRLELAKFRDHEFAKPRTDWPATFRNWLRSTDTNGNGRKKASGAPDEVHYLKPGEKFR